MKHESLAALAAAAVLGGCGGGSSSPTTAATAARTTTTQRARLVAFAQCLRTHGVPHFPDPDAKGEFQFGIDVSATVWNRANDACRALKPPGTFSTQRNRQQQSAGLTFARCMRAHGVKDFPDPVNGEPLINTYKIPSSNRPGGMTILNAAVGQCRTDLSKAAAGQ